jgi:hypothetical protein
MNGKRKEDMNADNAIPEDTKNKSTKNNATNQSKSVTEKIQKKVIERIDAGGNLIFRKKNNVHVYYCKTSELKEIEDYIYNVNVGTLKTTFDQRMFARMVRRFKIVLPTITNFVLKNTNKPTKTFMTFEQVSKISNSEMESVHRVFGRSNCS